MKGRIWFAMVDRLKTTCIDACTAGDLILGAWRYPFDRFRFRDIHKAVTGPNDLHRDIKVIIDHIVRWR